MVGARPELLFDWNDAPRPYWPERSSEAVIRLSRVRFGRIVREGRPDRRARDRLQLTLLEAEALTRNGVLAADATSEIGRVVRTQREVHTGFMELAQWMGFVASRRRRRDVGRRDRPRARSRARRSPARVPGPRPRGRRARCGVTGQRRAPRGPTRRRRARPRGRCSRGRSSAAISYASRNWPGRVARLVAGEVEADDVGMAVLGVAARDVDRRLDAEVADRGDQDPGLDAGVAAGVVDPGRDPRVVVGVGQARPIAAWSGERSARRRSRPRGAQPIRYS